MPERFLYVHGIGKGKLDYVLKSLKKRVEAPGDEREKHTNRKYKLLEEIRMKIHEHVDSLEGRESHNSWHDSKRKCVLAEPDIKNLYDMFKERYPEVVVSYETYTTISSVTLTSLLVAQELTPAQNLMNLLPKRHSYSHKFWQLKMTAKN